MSEFKLKVKRSNLDGSRGEKLAAALALLERVVASPEFKTLVCAHKHYDHAEGLDSARVYERLLRLDNPSGGEAYRTVEFDYELVARPWYKRASSVVGWRAEGTNDIFTYSDVFDRMQVAELSSHLGHEIIGHLAGDFGHPWRATPTRANSVPYVVDGFIEQLARKFSPS